MAMHRRCTRRHGAEELADWGATAPWSIREVFSQAQERSVCCRVMHGAISFSEWVGLRGVSIVSEFSGNHKIF